MNIFKKCEQIEKDRTKEYGSADKSFGNIASLWSLYTGNNIDQKDVAIMMALMKISRIRTTPSKHLEDSYIDAINYLKFASEFHIKDEEINSYYEELFRSQL